MPAARRRPLLSLLLILMFVFLGCAGCSWLDQYRGDGFQGKEATWVEGLRPKAETTESFFFNRKSSEIEESLGL